MFLKFVKNTNEYKKSTNNKTEPIDFLKNLFKTKIRNYILSFIISLAGIILLLGVLSYTDIIGGPYGFAKFLFWATILVVSIGLYSVAKARSFIQKFNTSEGQNKKNIIDVDVK